MSCERFSEAITDHACGASLGGQAAAHLAACEACRRAVAEQRQLLADADAALRDALALPASPDFAMRVMTRLRQREPAVSRSLVAARWWVGLAAAASLGVAVYLGIARPFGPDTRPTPAAAARVPQTQAPPIVERSEPAPALSKEAVSRTTRRPDLPDRATVSRRRAEPEVIVPPNQMQAIARLRELIRAGRLDDVVLPQPAASGDVFIEPLTIPVLSIPEIAGENGAGARATDRQ
jgi:hypothetical protein